MTYTVVIFAWRRPDLTPEAFKTHYETSHVPLVKSLSGSLFPDSHTRYYIQRTSSQDASNHPATILIGDQEDFGYDAYAELIFKDESAFQAFFGAVSAPDAAAKIAADEEKFLDKAKMKVAVVDDIKATRRD